MKDRFGWLFWFAVITIISLCMAVGYGAIMVKSAHSAPPEPPIETMVDMEPHPSLGGVFHYENGEAFSHAKKGAIRYVDQEPGYKVFVDLQEIWFVTEDGALYIFWIFPDFYFDKSAGEHGRFVSVVGKTWPPCGCE